jgi:soluble lytic murein transglycosylase
MSWAVPVLAGLGIVATLACSDDPPSTAEPPSETPTAVRPSPTDTRTEEPEPTATATLAPTPAPNLEEALSAGRELRRSGRLDEAASVLSAAAQSREPEALAELGIVLLEKGDPGEAADVLRRAEVGYRLNGDDQSAGAIAYQLGRTLSQAGDTPGALAALARADAAGVPGLHSYVNLLQGDIHQAAGDVAQAVAAWDEVATTAPEAALRVEARLRSGEARIDALAFDQAAADFSAALADAVSPNETTAALWGLARAQRVLGDPAFGTSLLEIVANYPTSARADDALAMLVDAGQPPSGLIGGIVAYRHGNYASAQEQLTAYLALGPTGVDLQSALFYLAATEEELGLHPEAIAHYDAARAAAPDGPLADNAAWWAARVGEWVLPASDLVVRYRDLALSYPYSEFAVEAGFRAGYLHLLHGNPIAAGDEWLALSSAGSVPAERFDLWLGWKALRDGRPEDAAVDLARASAVDRVSFWSERAEALLAGDPLAPKATLAFRPLQVSPEVETGAVREWLQAGTPDPFGSVDAAIPGAATAATLVEAGLLDQAASLLFAQLETDDPWKLFYLMELTHRLRLTEVSFRAAARLLNTAPPGAQLAAPRELWRLAYPVDYLDEVSAAAEANGLDPLLLYAIMRQESGFDANIGSSAGALGLMQVIPSTGEEIATTLGEEFSTGALLLPATSIRYGAYYIGRQLEAFDGDVYAALAAYNGGPGNAARWLEAGQGDPELFFEAIDFSETRRYVQYVMENLAAYRYAWWGLEAPSLVATP